MNCIKTELIQKYIDKTASAKEIERVARHIAACGECTARMVQLQHRAKMIRNALNTLVRDKGAIPGFVAPVGITKTVEMKRVKRYTTGLVAASVLICLVLAVMFTMNTRPRKQFVVVHTVDREINANHPVTNQLMEISIIDTNGKVTTIPENNH